MRVAELVQAAEALHGVDQATAQGNTVILNVDSAEAVLSAVLALAVDLGVTIRTINIQEPNLEAVFLHLTGRALRD
jgi:ABC-2 type transport system ATP-binding protein